MSRLFSLTNRKGQHVLAGKGTSLEKHPNTEFLFGAPLLSQRKSMTGFTEVLLAQCEKWELRSQRVLDSHGHYQGDSCLETPRQEW